MPGKGRRVASRQAELGRRRRRQGRGTLAVADEGVSNASDSAPVAAATTEERQSPSDGRKEPPVQSRPTPAAPQRTASRARLDRPAAYNYVVPELRRILIMSGVLMASLITLSFFI